MDLTGESNCFYLIFEHNSNIYFTIEIDNCHTYYINS